jgi:hypothetical protein
MRNHPQLPRNTAKLWAKHLSLYQLVTNYLYLDPEADHILQIEAVVVWPSKCE